jgi:hypothetical protein
LKVIGKSNKAYYGKEVSPVDIIMKNAASNQGSERLREAAEREPATRRFSFGLMNTRSKMTPRVI